MRSFTVKLEGPPGSRKSTFINMIIEKITCKGVSICKTGEHELEVTINRGPYPGKETAMPEFKEADKTMLQMAEKILDQNAKILEMNKVLIHALASPTIVHIEEGKEKTNAPKKTSLCR